VSGTKEAGTTVTVTCATATVGAVSYPTATTWKVDLSGFTAGNNVINATSADDAGNAATATATVAFNPATAPPQITVTTNPAVIWPPNGKLVPVKILGKVDANGASIKSVAITVSDEYGKYAYKNLQFGSTVLLETWRKGTDKDGRTYTVTVVVTDMMGKTTTKTTTVNVPLSLSATK